MFKRIIQFSLENRLIVLVGAIVLLGTGAYIANRMPVDIFPDLTAPTVTILVDAHGMAPEEIETLIAFPIETVMNGASGVRRIRSSLSMGIAVIWVEFEWGTEIYKARQIVTEKIQLVDGQLPPDIGRPILAPVSSLMGEIMLVGVSSDSLSPMELRSFADNILRKRLQAVSGVSQVVAIGGERKQYQVLADPIRLSAHGVALNELTEAVERSNVNSSGGFLNSAGQEILIRGIGRIETIEDLRRSVVKVVNGHPVRVDQVADVNIGPAVAYGTASVNGVSAVILSVQKQPTANTLNLSQRIDETVAEMRAGFPAHLKVDTHVFRQAEFIETAIHNVVDALRDGAILVAIILLLFLGSLRATFISLLAIPLSLVVAIFAMRMLGFSLNTMTLGGMAIAIGVIVDDAIIYVENVARRLRENRASANPKPLIQTVFQASDEIRQPMVIATFIIMAVFLPLFFLSGVEGRLLQPLGVAFVISVFASLLVAVTVVPALSMSMLTSPRANHKEHEPRFAARLKKIYRPSLEWALKKSNWVVGVAVLLLAVSLIVFSSLGSSFLPEFNEGSATIVLVTPPGTSLDESTDIGELAEAIVLKHPSVVGVARRSGRGELDEHSFGSNQTELEVRFKSEGFQKEEIFAELRSSLSVLPGTFVSIGQPVSHRIDHMLSGTQAAIAVKVFGSNLYELRRIAHEIKNEIQSVPGIVDLAVEPQVDVPQLRLEMNRDAMSVYGVQVEDLAHNLETAFNGEVVGQVLEGQIPFELVVRYPDREKSEEDAIARSMFSTPSGPHIPLKELAGVVRTSGPNTISRENVSRKIVVQANVSGRDLVSVVEDVQNRIQSSISIPQGYFVTYGGQFESAVAANRILLLLSIVAIGAILLLLYTEFGSFRDALLVMINLPLALIGGVFAIKFTSGVVTIAALVGFVTLFGIAARNGILLIAHYRYLMKEEKVQSEEAVLRGSLERMNPILMTALCAGLALIPLALGGGQPGKEIQTPMAIVILGGLLTSTALNMVVIPVLYHRFGAKS